LTAVRLSQLLHRDLPVDPEITGVTADSRRVGPGVLFAALPGVARDGADFAPQAVAAGAAAVLCGRDLPGLGVPVIASEDPRRAYALAAAAFHHRQPEVVVAVTGTNGKTSVAGFRRQIAATTGRISASMGTLGVLVSGPGQADVALTPPGLTTPDAGDVAALLADLAGRGVTDLALEASSHGIDQRRLDGVRLSAAAFLNLTQDHLDYHGDMDSYQSAKLRLFDTLLPRGAPAVLNADSPAFPAFVAAATLAGADLITFGEAGRDLRLTGRTPRPGGQVLSLEHAGRTWRVDLPLAGAFQAMNALAAAGLGIAIGEAPEDVFGALERLTGAPGRLQHVGSGPRGGEAYVDYAHTPDGLETVLRALRPHASGRLIVVFGAGGDRDRTKRPLMGDLAARLADRAIVTDDNPRSEDPAAIRAEVSAGTSGLEDIGDRREAIRSAVASLREGDVLVVAGKGHEQGQTIAGVVHPFDDVAETRAALEDRS
jgi:UDP-N-acetylmuramoyl-L-alanyl-D-glutamate--2,6-diaminopimelate ligase